MVRSCVWEEVFVMMMLTMQLYIVSIEETIKMLDIEYYSIVIKDTKTLSFRILKHCLIGY